jgi:hypothetical protein
MPLGYLSYLLLSQWLITCVLTGCDVEVQMPASMLVQLLVLLLSNGYVWSC